MPFTQPVGPSARKLFLPWVREPWLLLILAMCALVLAKLDDFLPKMAASNRQIEETLRENPGAANTIDIKRVGDTEDAEPEDGERDAETRQATIEMDVALFPLDDRKEGQCGEETESVPKKVSEL